MAKCKLCGGKRRPGTEIKFCTKLGDCLRAYNREYRASHLADINTRQRERRRRLHPSTYTRGEPMAARVSLFFSKTDIEAIELAKRKGECRSETIRRLVRSGLGNAHQEST